MTTAPQRVLMVAYHFPPLAGSSGIQRALRFVQHLPSFGWQPLVLTADPRAYENTSNDLLSDVPANTVVRRAFALDTARHLSIGGRYVASMARPDRWVSWRFGAVREGLRMVREYRPAAIWSTYPIATAHLIGAELSQRTGLPWIADFRDPMAQDGYPADPLTHRSFLGIESRAMALASACTFTTPGAARLYRDRYLNATARIEVLENGYDEESFAAAEHSLDRREPLNPGAVTLLHSGIVYPSERDPTALFAALGRLKASGAIDAEAVKLRFRAAVHEELLHSLARQHAVQDLVEVLPPIPYRLALAEMLRADSLLVMQGENCNEQIPAKVYEYLRAGPPIMCLSDERGDTSAVLRAAGIDAFAQLADSNDIARALPVFLARVRAGAVRPATVAVVRAASRHGRAEALARLLAVRG